MLLMTGCKLSSDTKDKLFGNSKVTDVVYSAVQVYNYELLDEYFADKKISKDLMNSMLGTAIHNKDNYRMTTYLFEHGADSNDSNRNIWDMAYNGWYLQLKPYLDNKDTNFDVKNELGHSAFYQALDHVSSKEDWYTYTIAKEMLEHGAKIESYFFENHDPDTGRKSNPYSQLIKSPRTTRMLFNKFIADGNTIDLPVAVQDALSGNITKCLETVLKNEEELDDGDKWLIAVYASYFGTVDEYKELSKLLPWDYYIYYRNIAACGNTEMLEYYIEKENVDLEIDEERYREDTSYYFDYIALSECLDRAASFGEYDTCKYLLEHHLQPVRFEGFSSLANAIISGNMDIVKLVYSYIIDIYGEITEKQLGHTLMQVGKTYGRLDSYSEYKNEVFQFFFDEGFDLSELTISLFNNADYHYLLRHGMPVSDELVDELIRKDDADDLRYIIENGYKPTEENLVHAVNISSSEVVKLLLDNGAPMPNDILNQTNYSSKAVVKLLIDYGASTDAKATQIPVGINGNKSGEFSLKEYWKAYGRDDLVKLL